MKLIQHDNGKVVSIKKIRDDASNENTVVVNGVPKCEYRPGFNGVLKYDEITGLYWDYEEVAMPETITPTEFQKMLEEVM